ncbi:SAM-dependent DNA methyltransferase [Paeniglutamicibacter gangotriensis]|uniref:site-specific DNA-methyltransferase (adenine-specific) n=1 Tax=Paeniglutamicibacter gangotriensis TaxID=254787 RepID=A0A5B0E562_9MICC|nr:class I SAM-dependent DNA methyltransferase [Paeniglutamicibacter gangotriensis]KAA0973021.1 SAM-dependent DNA methyltransferase [Paeniglutamicibacter gangotriensis]
MAGNNNANLVWSIANILRGTYKPAQYGSVILPFTILRRLDGVLAGTKNAVLKEAEAKKDLNIPLDAFLQKASGHSFFNTSQFNFARLLDDPTNIKANILNYVQGFSENTRDIFERFEFYKTLEKLDGSDLLYHVVKDFAAIDLRPETISNIEMGLMFEELIRRFAESSNETAGEHFTPREVIQLMVQLLLNYDDDVLTKEGIVRSIYDPTAGTGGMLTVAQEHLHALNPSASLVAYGQEINDESYAICKSDLLIKGQDISKISVGDTLANDQNIGQQFDFMLSNPPFGVEWKKIQPQIQKEHELHGFDGRFGPGLPRVSDGSLLFLLHLVRKMRPAHEGGSRIGIVLNGSPLFTGSAGSGESEIRKYLIENDLVEAIIALPTDMFYNTGIATYIWILSNNKKQKHPERVGKIQLINGVDFSQKMRKSLGSKRKELGPNDIADIVRLYGAFEDNGETSKIFNNRDFGYSTITVERPLKLNFAFTAERIDAVLAQKPVERLANDDRLLLEKTLRSEVVEPGEVYKNREAFVKVLKPAIASNGLKLGAPALKAVLAGLSERDETADVCKTPKGKPEADAERRDTENVPLGEDIQAYFKREVIPHVPDAWIDEKKTRVGYEIPFTRHFYKYVAPRPLDEIDADLNTLIAEITTLLAEVEK